MPADGLELAVGARGEVLSGLEGFLGVEELEKRMLQIEQEFFILR